MDDLWILLHAENIVKDWREWGTLYKPYPEDWEGDYATIACVAQQIYLAEQEELFYLRRRRQASSKRSRHFEEE